MWASWPCCGGWPAAPRVARTSTWPELRWGRWTRNSPRRSRRSKSLFNRIEQPKVFLAQRCALQQIGPVGQGFAQLLLATPAAYLEVVAVQENLGNAHAGELRRAACNAGSPAGLRPRAGSEERLRYRWRFRRRQRQSSQTRLRPRCPARRESGAWSRPSQRRLPTRLR